MKYKLLTIAIALLVQCQPCKAAPQELHYAQSTVIESASHCNECMHRRSITLRDMWDREHPNGTQHGHQAYQSSGGYYYHRPYNAGHYRQHRMRLENSMRPYAPVAESPRFSNGFQYADAEPSHLFRPLVRSTELATDKLDRVEDSRILEFSDWNRYEVARNAWKTKQALNGQSETPAKLSSHAKQ